MACFLVPTSEAIMTTVVQKIIEKKEKKSGVKYSGIGLTWSRRLSWLNKLLWGGSILLAFEHLWHGEIVPWPPFLTAMKNPGDVGPMLHEIATVGVTMAVTVTVVWGLMIAIAEIKARAMPKTEAKRVAGGVE